MRASLRGGEELAARVQQALALPTKKEAESGKPLNLDNLSKRVLIPILKAAGLEWHGWYSLRRGVATTLAGLTRDGMASKGLLRHTNLATTTRHYVKDVPENTLAAMNRLETLFTKCSPSASVRPN